MTLAFLTPPGMATEDAAVAQLRLEWERLDAPPDAEGRIDDSTIALSDPRGGAIRFEDADGNGRNEVLIDALPVGETIELRVFLLDADGVALYHGRTRPLVLDIGERRHVDIALYRVDSVEAIDRVDPPPARFLHTATLLRDGRVLIAGGFGAVRDAPCPEERGDDARCFAADALSDAWVFDPATALFFEVAEPMNDARGGHAAIVGADGLVALTGGASSVLLVHEEPPSSELAAELVVLPRHADGDSSALGTFDVFDPFANAECPVGRERPACDSERDGDPGRGGFLAPGALNEPRFGHASATLPSAPNRALLVGGRGNDEAPKSYEVFDFRKPGGMGVYDNRGAQLQRPRPFPGAVGVRAAEGDQVWIIGGGSAENNADLAEIWQAGEEDALGGTMPAPAVAALFPDNGGTDAPRYALARPQVLNLPTASGDDRPVITGWYGPFCDAAGIPVFEGPETAGRCAVPVPPSGAPRNFSINPITGETVAFEIANGSQAFAAVARVGNCIAVVGGTGQDGLTTNAANRISLLDASLRNTPGTIAGRYRLGGERMLAAAASLGRMNGVLVSGGLRVAISGGLTLETIAGTESLVLGTALRTNPGAPPETLAPCEIP